MYSVQINIHDTKPKLRQHSVPHPYVEAQRVEMDIQFAASIHAAKGFGAHFSLQA